MTAAATPSARAARETSDLIEVEGLKVHFPIRAGIFQSTIGTVKAVDDISFVIHRGDTRTGRGVRLREEHDRPGAHPPP